jgi:SAM-dependent methyltransferase
MHPDEIGRSYDTLAQGWQERLSQSSYGIAQLERAIKFTKNRDFALDVGCGSSNRIINLLLQHGFQVQGLDVSEKMIALIRTQFPNLSFYHEDISTWVLPRQYDLIAAWDSIWHLPLTLQEPVIRKICDGLMPDGVVIFTTAGLDEPGGKTDTNMGPPVHTSYLGIPKTLELLAQCGCVCRHLEYDQYPPEMHLYIIAQKGESSREPFRADKRQS